MTEETEKTPFNWVQDILRLDFCVCLCVYLPSSRSLLRTLTHKRAQGSMDKLQDKLNHVLGEISAQEKQIFDTEAVLRDMQNPLKVRST